MPEVNLINNGDAGTGTMEGWTHTNVSVQPNGAVGDYYFSLAPNAIMYQQIISFPYMLAYDNFDVYARFKFSEDLEPDDTTVKFYIKVTTHYGVEGHDMFIFCFQDTVYDKENDWFIFEHLVPIRPNVTLGHVVFSVETDDIGQDVGIDDIIMIRRVIPVQDAISEIEDRMALRILYGLDANKPALGVE